MSNESGEPQELRMNIPQVGTFTAKFDPAQPAAGETIATRQHMLDGKQQYTSLTGKLPIEVKLKNDEEPTKAHIFFTAYLLDGEDALNRPLMFVFNGGPGSSSVWLHLGAVGPRRVKMQREGWMPAPPYQLLDNEHTWLHDYDLVFIDPVGTGFSHAEKAKDDKKFWNIHNDITSLTEFIRRFLTKYERWQSPLFLAGESYGTTRAAGLAGKLFEKGMALNGLVLLSPVLNFQTLRFTQGNDLPYMLYLPTYAATRWYHDQPLESKRGDEPLAQWLAEEVRPWAEGAYSTALMQGERLSDEDREAILARLERYTGLGREYLDQSDLRINIQRFCKQLRRDEGLTVGRLDSRFVGVDAVTVAEFPEFDPSYSAILPPFTTSFNHYVRTVLGYEDDQEREYQILSFEVNRGWTFDEGLFPDTSAALHSAMKQNPYMQVFVGMGYYDLATPFIAIEYTLDHLGLQQVADRQAASGQHTAALAQRIHRAYYEAGHMMYLDQDSLVKLGEDIHKFRSAALPQKG